MSHLGDVIWLSQDSLGDAMGEFGAEDDQATRPVASSLFQRVAAVSRIAIPLAPPPEPAPVPTVAFIPAPAAVPAVVEPPAVVEFAAAPEPVPAKVRRGRWFVGVAALGLLALGQTPFVALWALQTVNGPEPIAIQVTKPPMAFAAIAAPFPVERALVPPPPRPVAPAPAAAKPAPVGSLSGWLRIDVSVPMRIAEDGRLLGTTDVDRLMLPTGDHVLDLRNDELGFATRQMVTIKAGETSILPVRLPSASISINAKPWAEAWVDGERVGETPIGTLMRTVGRHEVVLRHPELGERRVQVLVTMAQPARVIVDFKAGK